MWRDRMEPLIISKLCLMEPRSGLFRACFGEIRVCWAFLLTVVNDGVSCRAGTLGNHRRQHCACHNAGE